MSRAASPIQAPLPPPAPDPSRPPSGWVGFEGIVASGKTTQSRLLLGSLRSGRAEVLPEFGDHDLGRYLSRFGSPGMRLTPEGCEVSYIRHLLALSSHVDKLREATRRAATNVVLLDVATLTDAVYALADLPPSTGPELRGRMVSAVSSLIAMAQPPAGNGVLVYLDCDPQTAAQRLERRGSPAGPEQVDFLATMHGAYEELLRGRDDVVRVDARPSVDKVAAAIHAHLPPFVR